MMKKTAIILALFLMLGLFTGCGAERVKVDISDGGDLTAGAPEETQAVALPAEAEVLPEEESAPSRSRLRETERPSPSIPFTLATTESFTLCSAASAIRSTGSCRSGTDASSSPSTSMSGSEKKRIPGTP